MKLPRRDFLHLAAGAAALPALPRIHSKLRVLAAGIADDGLKYLALIKRADNGGNHVHQFELLPSNIFREKGSRIRRQFEEPRVKQVRKPPTRRPHRIE
jgi:hypothetical protein